MMNYYLYDHRDGLCHPFPFASYAKAEAHNRTLGGNYEVRGYKVRIVSEDRTEEMELDRVLEDQLEADFRKYEGNERYGY